jgi:hypothetical protein
MMSTRKNARAFAPAATPEARENQLVSLATDLAERQLREGTASSQVLTHFLKLASTRERLEQSKIENENLLLSAKVNQIASSERVEDMYKDALNAMRQYRGESVEEYDE